jgi:Domain of unknown function (DUF4123)
MEEHEPIESDEQEAAAKLRAALAVFPGRPFAVVDGGQFEDLPKILKNERLFGRSLFLDQADVEIQKAGPWLVGLDQSPNATDQVLAFVGDRPAAVFWSCEAGEAMLHGHLRTLNMVRVPTWAAEHEAPPISSAVETTHPAMFRHWDPRVLGALMPLLDAGQFARMLGPAEEIAFLAEDYGGVRRVLADPAGPSATPGMLTIRSEQTQALNKRRLGASHRRIAAHLKALHPDLSAQITDQEMITHVAMSDRIGRSLGLKSEVAHGDWAYLMLMSHGRIARSPAACAFVSRGGSAPDTQVALLRESTAEALKGWSLRVFPAKGGGGGGAI